MAKCWTEIIKKFSHNSNHDTSPQLFILEKEHYLLEELDGDNRVYKIAE